MNIPSELKYTAEHEWARMEEDGTVTVGITDHAQDALGDITFLELPQVDDNVDKDSSCGVIESVKTFSDLYAPLSGVISAINETLDGDEECVNNSPYENGWLFKLTLSAPDEWDQLLDSAAYKALLDKESE